MKIRAALARSAGAPFEFADVDLREPAPGEVLVDIVATGLCHTDLIIRDQWFKTPLPAVLGHEGSGIVRAIGPGVQAVVPGDRVVLSYNRCGRCRNCLSGHPNYCDEFWGHNFGGSVPGGDPTISEAGVPISGNFFGQSSFASIALANERCVVKVDDRIPLELLGPLGCGIQTGAGAVLNTLRPPAGSTLVVFGAGAVGLSAIMAAKIAGCTRIFVVDKVQSRLTLAVKLGATDPVIAGSSVPKHLRAATSGGVDFAVEATGVPLVLRQAMDSLSQRGTCALVGSAAAQATAEIDMSTLLFGRRLIGVIEGDAIPQIFIPRLIDLHAAGDFPFEQLVSAYPFDDINRAVEDSLNGSAIKPVLTW